MYPAFFCRLQDRPMTEVTRLHRQIMKDLRR